MVLRLFLKLKIILFVQNLLSERMKDLVKKVFTFFYLIPSFQRVQFNVGEKKSIYFFQKPQKDMFFKKYFKKWLIKTLKNIYGYRKSCHVHLVLIFVHQYF